MTAPALRSRGAAAAEDELLAQLGLPPSASPEDVDELHLAVSQFLAAAPAEIRGWAHAQAAALDKAYLTLTDPVGLQGSALRSPAGPPAVVPGGPATPPARRGSTTVDPDPAPDELDELEADELDDDIAEAFDETPVVAAAEADVTAETADAVADDEPDLSDFEALYASVTPSAHDDMRPDTKAKAKTAPVVATAPAATQAPRGKHAKASKAATRAAAAPAPVKAGSGVLRKVVVGVASLGVLAAVLVGVYSLGGGTADPAVAAASAAPSSGAPAVDAAKVADLMGKYQADPQDVANLLALADEFYAGGLWTEASGWIEKVLAIEPENTRALLAKGAIAFNSGDTATAETTWKKVVELEPDNVEAHYDLGFLYLNSATPDWAGLQREWNEVIRLDPESDLAKTVQAHLASLEMASMLPASSPAASGAPGASPAASPEAVAPTGTVVPVAAKDLAFNTSALAAPADEPFTIRFANNEDGLPHDVQLKDASGATVFAGELVTGPTTVDYQVPALKAGTYTFLCSIHPTMTGTLTVGS